MEVTFWGVRGSIATSGPETLRVGGHTTCVEVRHEEARIILDAGTGIRPLGLNLLKEADAHDRPVRANLFFTHLHWDHIQGFPFFAPAFAPDGELALYGPRGAEGDGDAWAEGALEAALEQQMRAPTFPVPLAAMRARRTFHGVVDGDTLEVGPFSVRARTLDHPNGCLGYRIEAGGRSVCFATDTEQRPGELHEGLLDLARDVDLLVLDAQYTPEEYDGRGEGPPRRGWGHSTYEAAAEVARAANARALSLFHHDPTHDDAFVARMEWAAQGLFSNVRAAREGWTVMP